MSRSQQLKDFLTVAQATKVLRVTRSAVLMAIERGRLGGVLVGHMPLISRKSLEAYKKTRRVGRPPK